MNAIMRPILIVVVAFLSWSSRAGAQGFPPARFTNLHVLPKDSRAADVVGTMKSFTRALGVRCQHCHVGEEGLPLEQFDFVADTKAPKVTARAMMRLVAEINSGLDNAVPNTASQPRVTCWTCQGGRITPQRQPQ